MQLIFATRLSGQHPKGRRNSRNERHPRGVVSESLLAGGTPPEPEPLQFIKHSEKLWWVCLDGRYLGSIHNLLTGLFHVSIYSDSRKLSLSNSYTSFDLAEKAVREHFGEGAFNAFEWLP